MAEISDSELTIIENALVTVTEAISEDASPQAEEIKKMIVEAQQIVSGKLDSGNDSGTAPAANAGIPENQALAGGAAMDGGMPMEDAQKMMSMMQEMMTIMQKAMSPTGGQEQMSMEECMASGKSHEECLAMMNGQKMMAAPPTA